VFRRCEDDGEIVGGEDILPRPFAGCVRIFPVQGAGKINGAAAVREVLVVEFLNPGEVRLQRAAESLREDGNAFPHTLALSNGNLPISKIDILDAQPETFEQAQTAPVEEVGHDPVISLQMGENGASFGSRKDDGKLGRAANTLDGDKFELPIEHLLVEEKQGAESLVCVEAATFESTARWVRKAAISGSPISAGWRFPWKRMKRRIQSK